MKFSYTHPIATHPYNPDFVTGEGVGRLAAAADAAGFDGVGFTDHPAPSQKWLEQGGHDSLDPFVALSFAAARTTRLRLIPNIVVLPYRNPFVVAKAAASLDMLSGGRFTLAVGTGYLKSEFAAVGVAHAERNDLFDEALAAIVKIWTEDDVSIEGRTYSARGVTAHPRPVTQPHPPIWIGGNGERARQRVADVGAGWSPFPASPGVARTSRTVVLETHEDLAAGVDDLRRRLEIAGRDPSSVDVAFTLGGHASGDDFNAERHMEGLAALARIGVTWVWAGVPNDSLDHALETVDRYGREVISVYDA